MDPNIMKFLEEDEDESLHSGADVEAFQAALNRDIGGDNVEAFQAALNSDIGGDGPSISQLSDSASLPHDSNQTSIQVLSNWQTSGTGSSYLDPKIGQQQQVEQHSTAVDSKQQGSASDNRQQNDVPQEPSRLSHQQNQPHDDKQQRKPEQFSIPSAHTTGMQISGTYPSTLSESDKLKNEDSGSQYSNLHTAGNQQTTLTDLTAKGKQIPFVLLLPSLRPHLDKDKEMQLQTLFLRLKKNEIAKDQFVRLMRNLVGDHVLKMAVSHFQSQIFSQPHLQAQFLARQHPVRAPVNASSMQFENSTLKLREAGHKMDTSGIQVTQMASSTTSIVNQERDRSTNSIQGHNMHVPQTSYPMYGGGNYHPHSSTNIGTSGSYIKQQPHDLQMRQVPHKQTVIPSQLGGPNQASSMPKFDRQSSTSDSNKVQSSSIPNFTNKQVLQQNIPWQPPTSREQSSAPFSSMNYVKQEPGEQPGDQQLKSQFPNSHVLPALPVEQGNATSGNLTDESEGKQSLKVNFPPPPPVVPPRSITATLAQMEQNNQLGTRSITSPAPSSAKTPPKKPTVGQKKPAEALGSSTPMSSKKQKVSGAYSDQSIEQLNDVTAVSGVNLREEEEQLFSGSKEESRASEACRRVVQEEEERLLLQKNPLQKKLAEIMAKNGLKNISSDLERCLSLCVEERMRGLISNIIRVSKQRVDAERPRHRTVITSDVQQQIMTMNQKVREEWEKKQADAEKLRKGNEPEDENMIDGDKDKEDGRGKATKVHKEEDDKMRTNAANVAARVAVGGDDTFSKWQLWAEQARQKREGEATSGSQPPKDGSQIPASSSGRNTKDNLEAEKRSAASPAPASGSIRKVGRNQVILPQNHIKVARSVSVKDVIAVLEREPQMSKSTLLYRLHERTQSHSGPE